MSKKLLRSEQTGLIASPQTWLPFLR